MAPTHELIPDHEKDLREAHDKVVSMGIRPFPVVTNHPALPWVIVRIPSMAECDAYALASRSAPLSAAIQLFHQCSVACPADFNPGEAFRLTPFLPMRALQVLLGSLGLGVRAEKKSLT